MELYRAMDMIWRLCAATVVRAHRKKGGKYECIIIIFLVQVRAVLSSENGIVGRPSSLVGGGG